MTKDVRATEALLKSLRTLCKKLPGSEEYIMVHHPAFRVGKKPFAIVGLSKAEATALSVNLGHMEQGELLDDERFLRTPYIGQHGWVSIEVRDSSPPEIEKLVVASWRRVAGKKHLAARENATKAR
jgi:predicted DNA-binding protein (MmcQ/YjbR family)